MKETNETRDKTISLYNLFKFHFKETKKKRKIKLQREKRNIFSL